MRTVARTKIVTDLRLLWRKGYFVSDFTGNDNEIGCQSFEFTNLAGSEVSTMVKCYCEHPNIS